MSRRRISDKEFLPEKTHIRLTSGESLRIARELQNMTQAQLAERAGLTQATISGIERGRVSLGVERAKRLALVLRIHPAVLLFPNWQEEEAKWRRKWLVGLAPGGGQQMHRQPLHFSAKTSAGAPVQADHRGHHAPVYAFFHGASRFM